MDWCITCGIRRALTTAGLCEFCTGVLTLTTIRNVGQPTIGEMLAEKDREIATLRARVERQCVWTRIEPVFNYFQTECGQQAGPTKVDGRPCWCGGKVRVAE